MFLLQWPTLQNEHTKINAEKYAKPKYVNRMERTNIITDYRQPTMALKGMEPAPNPQRRGGSKQLEGGSFKFVTPAPIQGKTKHTPNSRPKWAV